MRARLVAGDECALGECYDQYASFVYGIAVRVIGDRRAAEDVSQDVFVGLWERPAAFDPDRGSLRSYLLAQCHGRAVDLMRSIKGALDPANILNPGKIFRLDGRAESS